MERDRTASIVYRNLTRVPHGDKSAMTAAFREALEEHPDQAARSMVYIAQTSKIRDQQEAAITALLQASSRFPEYREAGRCLLLGSDVYQIEPERLPGLLPFQIFRVESFIRGSDRKVVRVMRGAMTDYLRLLESNATRFDGVLMRNRKELKSAYMAYHIKMGSRAEATFIHNKPPADSKMAVLKQIANSSDVREQARLVVEHKIPYTVATSVLPKVTPAVGVALIDVMSPQEALNSRRWVESSGLLNIPEVREAYETKVAKATASIATIEHRRSAQGQDAGVQAAVERAVGKATRKEAGKIKGQTDLALDHSGSMGRPIGFTPQVAARLIPMCEDVALFAHTTSARQVKIVDTGNPLRDAQQALRGVRAGGGTSFDCYLMLTQRLGRTPERIVFLTDGGERTGRFHQALARYEEETGVTPQLTMLRFQGHDPNWLAQRLTDAGYHIDVIEVESEDYHVLDQLVAILQGERPMSILDKIMATELPRRVR
jgi:hypothetical protein